MNKVQSLVNIILDGFLKETIALNIIILAKMKEVMARKSDITNHNNHPLVINNTVNVSKLV